MMDSLSTQAHSLRMLPGSLIQRWEKTIRYFDEVVKIRSLWILDVFSHLHLHKRVCPSILSWFYQKTKVAIMSGATWWTLNMLPGVLVRKRYASRTLERIWCTFWLVTKSLSCTCPCQVIDCVVKSINVSFCIWLIESCLSFLYDCI